MPNINICIISIWYILYNKYGERGVYSIIQNHIDRYSLNDYVGDSGVGKT